MRAVGTNGCTPSTEYGTSLFVIDNQWYQPYPLPVLRLAVLFGANQSVFNLWHTVSASAKSRHEKRDCLVKAYYCELRLSLNLRRVVSERSMEVTYLDERV